VSLHQGRTNNSEKRELSHLALRDDDLNTHYQEHYKTKGPPHPCSVGVCMSIHSDLGWIQDMT